MPLTDPERREVADAIRRPANITPFQSGRLRALRDRAEGRDVEALDRVLGVPTTGPEPLSGDVAEALARGAARARTEQERARPSMLADLHVVGGLPAGALGTEPDPSEAFWSGFDDGAA